MLTEEMVPLRCAKRTFRAAIRGGSGEALPTSCRSVPVLLFACWIPAILVHQRNLTTSAGGPSQGYLQQRLWHGVRVTVVVGLLIMVTAFFDQMVGLGSKMGLVAGNAVMALGVAVWLAWRDGGSGGGGVGPAGSV